MLKPMTALLQSKCFARYWLQMMTHYYYHEEFHIRASISYAIKDFLMLMQVLESQQPLVVYFPDSSMWLSKAVSKSNRTEFVSKMKEMFDQLSGPVVLICGRNKVETGSNKEKEKFVSFSLPIMAIICIFFMLCRH